MRKLTRVTILCMALSTSMLTAQSKEKEPYRCPEEATKCVEQMTKHFRERGWVGINMDWTEEDDAVRITKVIPGSPAERAGLQAGDILRSLNDIEYNMDNELKLKETYEAARPGRIAKFTVERDGQVIRIDVTMEPIPEAVIAQWIGNHLMEAHAAEASGEENKSP